MNKVLIQQRKPASRTGSQKIISLIKQQKKPQNCLYNVLQTPSADYSLSGEENELVKGFK